MGAFEIKPLTLDQSIRLHRTGFTDPLVRPANINEPSSGNVTKGTTGGIIATYDAGDGRLTSFVHPDPESDDKRLAYITLINPNNAKFDDVDDKLSPVDRSVLNELFAQLSGKYDKFIVESMNTQRQEKASIIPTLGDNYAAMFTGKQPVTIAVAGHLICDYDKKALSWYKAFTYAYEYFLRASRLAKFRVKVRIVFPDVNEFEGYILGTSESQNSNDDMIIPWNFTMLATSLNPFKPYLPSSTKSSGKVEQKTSVPFPNAPDLNNALPIAAVTAPGAVPFDFGRSFMPAVTSMDVDGVSKAFTNAQKDILGKASVAFQNFPDVARGLSVSPETVGGIVKQNLFADSANTWFNQRTPVINEAIDKFKSTSEYVYTDISRKMRSLDLQNSVAKLNKVVAENVAAPGLIDIKSQDMFGKRKEYRNGGSLW